MPALTAADFEAIVDSGIGTTTIEAAIARDLRRVGQRTHGPLRPDPDHGDGILGCRRPAIKRRG